MEINTQAINSQDNYHNKTNPINEKEQSLHKKKLGFYYDGDIYLLYCDEDELMSSIIKKFKEKSKTENIEFYFISNGKVLNPENKINQLNFNLNFNRIDVYKEREMKGGVLSLKFSDLSKQITEEHFFSEKAPSYRYVTRGINIYGICKVKKCEAYKKEVIHRLKNIKKFDLIKEKEDLECPKCGGNITPKTVGFHLCEYRVKGKKYYDDKIEPFEFEGKAENKNSIQYYNPDKNGETTLIELIIEITKYL